MAFKTMCLLLVLAVAAYAYPQGYGLYGGSANDPGFSNGQGQGGFPTQGNGVNYDRGFSNGQGQGGFPSQGSDTGFGNGQGQGGFGHQGGFGNQGNRQRHRGGYQEHGY